MKKTISSIIIAIIALTLFIISIIYFNSNLLLGVIFLIMDLALITFVITGYNSIIKCHNKINESISLIDIQLKNRFDIIPNLVNIVKGYTAHEKSIINAVVKLRNQAINSTDEEKKLEYANKLIPNVKNLIAIGESYPNIKADALFKNLMEQLVDVEDRIVAARRIYDSNVNIYNTMISSFPNNILAYMFDCKKEKLFVIETGENLNHNIKL